MATPKNLIVGGASLTLPKIEIPTFSGSPDILPTGLQFNDEFDQDTAGVPAGWTSFSGPTTVNTNDSPSGLHLATTDTTNVIRGIYRALPALTYPLTIKMKVNDYAINGSAVGGGIAGFLISPVAPGTAGTGYGMSFTNGQQGMSCNMSSGALNGNGSNTNINNLPGWLSATMSSNTSLAPLYSSGGLIYLTPPSAVTETLAAAAAYLVLFVAGTGGNPCNVVFDYIRIK